MNVSLTPELEKKVRDLVESGQFASNSEVIRAALRGFSAHRDLSRFERAILASQADIDAGRLVPWNAETRRQIEEEARRLIGSDAPLDPDVVV